MDQFAVANKVAVITGGASGIGLQCAVELLENGAKGVTVADIVPENGNRVIEELQKKFGKKKVIFVKTDVTDYDEFERAFKDTVEQFGNVDILINCAGYCNERNWQNVVAVNINGVIHGMLLALENYIPKCKSGSEGLILNISSIGAPDPATAFPIYSSTKLAVLGMTLAWGSTSHFERCKVRVIGVCPGGTNTPMLKDLKDKTLDQSYDPLLKELLMQRMPKQSVEEFAQHIIRVIEQAPNGTMWVIEGGERPYQYKLLSRHDIMMKQLL